MAFRILVLLFCSFHFLTYGSLIRIESVAEISSEHPQNTLFLFDIDDTLVDSPTMLGSKAWRKSISESRYKDWHDSFSLQLARHYPIETVEKETASFIHTLLEKGYSAAALTSRERNFWYETAVEGVDALTIKQLKSVGIHLSSAYFTDAPEYYEGVFFANLDPKGKYLETLFQNFLKRPEKVIFIDDKFSQVESVDQVLTDLGIAHECFWYCATDEKARKFDPLIANVHLYYFLLFRSYLSDEEARVISQQKLEDRLNFLFLNISK